MLIKSDDNGLRPDSGLVDETKCFYCLQEPTAHKKDCVTQKRTIVVKMEIECVLTVPQGWDEHEINFYLNDSSWCAGNAIDQFYDENNEQEGTCFTCHRSSLKYLRDATSQDHERLVPPGRRAKLISRE